MKNLCLYNILLWIVILVFGSIELKDAIKKHKNHQIVNNSVIVGASVLGLILSIISQLSKPHLNYKSKFKFL